MVVSGLPVCCVCRPVQSHHGLVVLVIGAGEGTSRDRRQLGSYQTRDYKSLSSSRNPPADRRSDLSSERGLKQSETFGRIRVVGNRYRNNSLSLLLPATKRRYPPSKPL